MAETPYETRLHRQLRAQWRAIVEAGQADCAEIVCVKPNRRITPGTRWHLAHDRRVCIWPNHHCTPACYLGPAHETCNTTEAGKERHKRASITRWAL